MSVTSKDENKHKQEVANIPPSLSDLHCFTETEGVITTSAWPPSVLHLPTQSIPPETKRH